jgi:transporter family protein
LPGISRWRAGRRSSAGRNAIGNASQAAPIDKLSVVLVAIFGAAFLGERLASVNWLGVALIGLGAILVAYTP